MQIEKIDLSEERKLITYMIVSKRFLTEIAPIIKIQHLETSFAKITAGWILEYYKHYKDSLCHATTWQWYYLKERPVGDVQKSARFHSVQAVRMG